MAIVVISLPFLNLGMSIGGFWLAGAWVLHTAYQLISGEDRYRNLHLLRENSIALFLIGVFLLHVVGMIHTEDISYGLKDLRIKLPMLFMPVVFTGIPAFSTGMRKYLEDLFILACASAALVIIFKFGWADGPNSVRDAHPFISHIRFGLMVALAAYLSSRGLIKNRSTRLAFAYLPLLLLFFYYFIRMQSITGVLTFLAAIVISGLVEANRSPISRLSRFTSISLLIIGMVSLFVVGSSAYRYFTVEIPEKESLPKETSYGHAYFHKYGDSQVENGHLIWYNISWGEMAGAWRTRSEVPYESTLRNGQDLSHTLIRYLSSKGLKKDKDGVMALSDEDIANIEMGYTNFLNKDKNGLLLRLHKVYFEVNAYLNGANPSGNSLTQRFEFWKAGKHILSQKWLIGTGTGDLPRAFERAYEEIDTKLDPAFRHRAHNQYMTLWIGLGIPGLLAALGLIIFPFFDRSRKALNPKSLAFLTIIAFSFLTEDTLETQVGQTFFSFFYCYFLILDQVGSKKQAHPQK